MKDSFADLRTPTSPSKTPAVLLVLTLPPLPPLQTKTDHQLPIRKTRSIYSIFVFLVNRWMLRLGATVQKVDQGLYYVYLSLLNFSCIIASSTSILLDGKTPGQYNGPLLNGRIKQKIVHGVKGRSAPAGNGIPGLSPTGNTSVRKLEYKQLIFGV